MLNVDESSTISAEGMLDTVDLSLFPIPLIFSRSRIAGNTTLKIGGKTKPLREAGVTARGTVE
jgi:hypothetical protein